MMLPIRDDEMSAEESVEYWSARPFLYQFW
jgi:hypothetical protein